jgi:methionyl-tRNA synthetase
MSKSLGNFVTIEVLRAYAQKYSLDALRWYLLTQGPLGAQDADFSHPKFVEVYNTDLANGIGNCASRVANMIEKYFGGSVPAPGVSHAHAGFDWPAICNAAVSKARAALADHDVATASLAGIELIRCVDQYINVTAPFKLAKTVENDPNAKAALGAILYHCAEAVRIASVLLCPAMPDKVAQLWNLWRCTPPEGATLADLCVFAGEHALRPGQTIAKGEALFMRADTAEAPPA